MAPSFHALFGVWALFAVSADASTRAYRSQAIEISNDSGQRVVVDWQNPKTGQNIKFSDLTPGEKIQVDTFPNHTFVLHFENDTCADQVCRNAVVTVSDRDHQGTFQIQIYGKAKLGTLQLA
jgi:hypothetical protein